MWSGLDQPDQHRVRGRRPHLRRREERPVIKVFDNPTDTTADAVRRPERQRPQLLGPRAARHGPRTRTSRPTPSVYVLYTYDHVLGTPGGAPRWGTAGVLSDPCPTPPGPTGDGCVVSGRLSRLTASRQPDDRHRAGADRGLVPAVPEPLHRRPGLRGRRRPVRHRRRRGQLQLRRLGPGRQPAQPLRRPAGRGRRHPDPADGRGRRPAQPGPAHHRPTRPPWTAAVLRLDPDTGAALPDNPLAGSSRPQRPPHRRPRPAQPVPHDQPARHQRAVGRRRRLGHLGGDQPHPDPDRPR